MIMMETLYFASQGMAQCITVKITLRAKKKQRNLLVKEMMQIFM